MHEDPVHQCILKNHHNQVDIVSQLWSKVLKHEGERLETTHAHVQLHCAVLVQDSRDAREWPARLGNDGNGDGAADVGLARLHVQVSQED